MLTLADLFDRNARYFGQREAFVCDGERLTHARYAERSRRLASALHGLGLRRQDRFAILAMNCLEFYEAYAAAEYGATILVPVNFRLNADELCNWTITAFEQQNARNRGDIVFGCELRVFIDIAFGDFRFARIFLG